MQLAKVKYGTEIDFLEKFNPGQQVEFCGKYMLECFASDVPKLRDLSVMYGENVTSSWLEIQLKDLMEYAGVREKMTIEQIANVAGVIRTEFGYLKFTELMVFFHWLKSGKYGRFYGSVDGMVITEALWKFLDDRSEKLRVFRRICNCEKKQLEILQREQMERNGLLLSLEEWRELSWLFNM